MIRRITDPGLAPHGGLCALLCDVVEGGASVGFLAPLSAEAAGRYWDATLDALGSDSALWVAERDGQVVGSVQLSLCNKENGLHRAEVQKLFVLRACQGRGIASQLMAALEAFARSNGRTLLVLDTQTGSHAEAVYRHLGWQPAGEVPRYAATPDGRLHATTYYYKEIPP